MPVKTAEEMPLVEGIPDFIKGYDAERRPLRSEAAQHDVAMVAGSARGCKCDAYCLGFRRLVDEQQVRV